LSSRWYHQIIQSRSTKGSLSAVSSAAPSDSATAEQIVSWAIDTYKDRLALVTSFQYEGMVIVDLAARISKDIRIITLDTGRLPPETFDMIEAVRARYGVAIEVVSPEASELESMVSRHGPNLFYESVPLRTTCCHFRKVRPLNKKLSEFDAWLTGLRRAQSETREDLAKISQENGRAKISPLADWTREDVEAYTVTQDVPRHPLYAKGYTSIGCAPCSRATEPGEDERAGRWWWESGVAKECGLHFTPDGRAMRTVDVLIHEILDSSNAA
jgi:phosphoadenosine phosphosulfate reductase